MDTNTIKMLEYDKIKKLLEEYAVSELGKEIIRQLEPSTDMGKVQNWLQETTEARRIMDKTAGAPLQSLVGIEGILGKLGKGSALTPEELSGIQGLLRSGSRLKRFMEDKEYLAPMVGSYAASIFELKDVEEEISRCIVNHQIDDKATPELSKIRKKISIVEERIKGKLESILKSPAYRMYIQDQLVSMRNGRFVIPIKNEYRKNIEGTVLDSSASGSTVFIEPAEVRKLQDELNICKIEEEKEEIKILFYLTGMVESYQRELQINIETMVHYDFIFAKGKYSRSIDGNPVSLNADGYIDIREGRHPLIGRSAVPLDFRIGKTYRTLAITGPNTGGKTVALKTIGLFTMMAQSGLHVPAQEGTELAVFGDILVDIGDGQSIEQSLSTFSSHITNIIDIIRRASPYTLVILDELGAGTDPGEGVGLAVMILEEIYQKGATTIATTHFSEIKEFAGQQEGFENGCMEFDIHTLKPLYRLKIGRAGESNAFLIALRLGLEGRLVEKAYAYTYKEKMDFSALQRVAEVPIQTLQEEASLGKPVKTVKYTGEQTRKSPSIGKEEPKFKLGDCVYVSTLDRTGIVCEQENKRGEVGVMIMKKKVMVNKKRLSIFIDGKELYPPDYDFDIVLESKENRKKKKLMSKRHVEGLIIEREK